LREVARRCFCILSGCEGDGAHVLLEGARLCLLLIHSGYNAMLDEDANIFVREGL
jgi:predicted ATPase